MSTVTVPVVINEVDLSQIMAYFDADDPSRALSLALKWAAIMSKNYTAGSLTQADEPTPHPDNFTRKSKSELQQIAAYTFPDDVQKRLEELLDKQREGVIIENEKRELDQLVLKVQLKTIEKAKGMAALKVREETRI